MQMPDQGGVQHTQIIFQVPGIGKGHLTWWRRLTTQLMVEALYRGFLQVGKLTDMSGSCAQADQMNRFPDLCGIGAEFYAARTRVGLCSTM